jgi:hypothetical protein
MAVMSGERLATIPCTAIFTTARNRFSGKRAVTGLRNALNSASNSRSGSSLSAASISAILSIATLLVNCWFLNLNFPTKSVAHQVILDLWIITRVYEYFNQWAKDGTWERINGELVRRVRKAEGRDEEPSAAIIDSQSVKTVQRGASAATTRPST